MSSVVHCKCGTAVYDAGAILIYDAGQSRIVPPSDENLHCVTLSVCYQWLQENKVVGEYGPNKRQIYDWIMWRAEMEQRRIVVFVQDEGRFFFSYFSDPISDLWLSSRIRWSRNAALGKSNSTVKLEQLFVQNGRCLRAASKTFTESLSTLQLHFVLTVYSKILHLHPDRDAILLSMVTFTLALCAAASATQRTQKRSKTHAKTLRFATHAPVFAEIWTQEKCNLLRFLGPTLAAKKTHASHNATKKTACVPHVKYRGA
ncbi:unnamed protein product [Ranitomeya imitator]|uniref:LAGLIDADG endonuclease n=1 Tax=Ranitomeya imitator TaxID=111125 RepID=A0ABN9KT79_9NEOB|nr:unnamed protein product [Ranitomeya imitator]